MPDREEPGRGAREVAVDGDDDGVRGGVEGGVARGVLGDEPGGGEVAEQVAALDVAGGGLLGGGFGVDQAVLGAQGHVVAAPPALEGRQVVGREADERVASGRPRAARKPRASRSKSRMR